MLNLREEDIVKAEERLRLAMLNSDVNSLDQLVSADLLFTTHFGQLLGKQQDLQAHQSGALRFHHLEPSEMHIQMHNSFAIVSVRMQVAGEYLAQPFSEALRYTRVWAKRKDGLCVVGGHISAICKVQ